MENDIRRVEENINRLELRRDRGIHSNLGPMGFRAKRAVDAAATVLASRRPPVTLLS